MTDKILMEHGSGGRSTNQLIDEIFATAFNNDTLNAMEDAAVVEGGNRIAITTDSFVVTPLEFPGGDIGRLSVCGTVNDLLMRGAVPKYITSAYIIKEGTEVELLKRVVRSMAETAKEAGVTVVCGDTKVIEADGDGKGGIMINTAGVGILFDGVDIAAANGRPGDVIISSGNMGDHHAAILSQRLAIENEIQSDNAPLTEMVMKLVNAKIPVHTLRDVTRGGLGTILSELAEAAGYEFIIHADKVPVNPAVKEFAGLLGLDTLYMGNEGKMIAILPSEYAEEALGLIRSSRYGADACIIGEVTENKNGSLYVKTAIGGKRKLDVLVGEGLPRIC